ncbi:MAG: transketolase family protein [Actinomycetota bacterium]|nr:transketolase family protein [Actinomycetota bacterium]
MRIAPAVVEAPFATALVELGERRTDLVVLSADLSKYTDVLPFAEAFPDRFVQVGMAEQNMMGVAGGLAKTGFLPIAVTYGVFATRRAYDQVAMALATGPSRGIVVAFLPGITTPFKATHQAIDDIAIMRALPGMTVIDPADATEVAAALAAAVEHDGAVYMRGLRGAVAQLFDPVDFQFRIGMPRELLAGDEIGLAGSGLGTQWAMEAAKLLGADVGLLHVPTLKPLNIDAVASFCSRFNVVTTVENHSVVGGLAAAMAEVVTHEGLGTRIQPLGVPDRWAPAGSLPFIRAQLGLDAEGIARSAAAA